MSRCFGFPPPGYVLPEKDQPLIDTIKLQKEIEKAKEEKRKEKAKEEKRKERKKEKKDKKRKRESQSEHLVDEKSEKLVIQTSNLEGKNVKTQGDDISSDITNEHGQAVGLAKPSYSSDSQNSDKRRKLESPANSNSIKRTGTFLKIRLTSLKNNQSDVDAVRDLPSVKDRDQPSTSGRNNNPAGQKDFEVGRRLVNGQCSRASTSVGMCVPSASLVEKQPIRLETRLPNASVAVSKSGFGQRSVKGQTSGASPIEKQPITSTNRVPNADVANPKPGFGQRLVKEQTSGAAPIQKQPIILTKRVPNADVANPKPGFGQRVGKGQSSSESPVEKQPNFLITQVPKPDVDVSKPGLVQRPVKGQTSSVSPVEKQPILLETVPKLDDVPVSKSSSRRASKVELLYNHLLESWAVPAVVDDDEDWLFQRKSQKTGSSETTNASCSLDSNLWPRAQFLPSVDMYALPYTVPF